MHEFGVVGEPKYIFFNILIQSNIPEQSGPVGTRIEQDGFSLLSTLNWITLRVVIRNTSPKSGKLCKKIAHCIFRVLRVIVGLYKYDFWNLWIISDRHR